MNKIEYLKKLENLIQALPEEERKEALEYYKDYLDEAEDEKKAIEELGSPEELASSILEKFNCVPAQIIKEKTEQPEDENIFDEESVFGENDDKLCFEFDKKNIKNLGISVGFGNVFVKNGNSFKVETRGIQKDSIRCEINSKSTLIIECTKNIPGRRFFSGDKKAHICPRILITVPKNLNLSNTKIDLGGGQLKSQKLSVTSEKSMLNISAGNFELSGFNSKIISIRTGMGNTKLSGNFSDFLDINCGMGKVFVKSEIPLQTKINCGMGFVNFKTTEEAKNCSVQGKVSLGSITFNGEKRSGFAQSFSGTKKEKDFDIKCGLGEVKIDFNQKEF